MSVWCRSYARKSRALGDPDDPAIVSHQLEANDRAATAMGIALKPEERIAEVGSGESIEGRPRFGALLKELEKSPPGDGYLFVTEIARLSRADMLEIGQVMRTLRTAGVKVVANGRLFDLSDPNDELYFTFLAAQARHEVRNYSERVARKMAQLTRNGELTTGSAPYGYLWVKGRGRERGRLEPIPSEFEVVQALFREARHLSTARLSRKYGIPRPTVNYILRNPVYTGWPHRHTAWRKHPSGLTSSWMLPESQWGIRAEKPGDYPPAVSVEQFYAVRDALRTRWRQRAKTSEADGWCRRLLILEGWEGARVQLGSIDHEQTPCYYFIHPTTLQRKSYPRQPLHEAAGEKIVAALSNPEAVKLAIEQTSAHQTRNEDGDRLRQELHQLREKLVDLKIETAGRDMEDRMALETAQERVRNAIRVVQQQLSQIHRTAPENRLMAALVPLLDRLGPAAEALWERCSPSEKADLAGELLERIVVRIISPGRRRPCHREILEVEYAAWFRPFIE